VYNWEKSTFLTAMMAPSRESRAALSEDIIRQGELAYNPNLPDSRREVEQAKFEELLSK
jgi:hypothetical protein